jgi:hypothetical protein
MYVSGCSPTSIVFSAIVDDDRSGVASVTLRVRKAGVAQPVGQFALVVDGNTWSVKIFGSTLGTGTFTYEYRAVDKVGNATPFIGDQSLTFDVTDVCIE